MNLPDPSDLLTLDRDVARAHAAWVKWKRALAIDPEASENQGEGPLDRFRHVAGQSAYETLGKPSGGPLDPHREALRRWVYALMQARIAQPLDVEMAKAAAERSARVSIPKPHLVSWREGWRGLVTAATRAERASWLDAVSERGPAIASIARRLEERRTEAEHRMGFGATDPLFELPRTAGDLVSAAQTLLDRTDDLARDVLAKARRRAELPEDPPSPTDAIAIAVARDAPEGWPASLALPWLEGTFSVLTRGLRLGSLLIPSAVGASSFARACAAFGGALRVAGSSPSLPFALARDPEFTSMHRFACVFGALPASPAFQKRVLGNVARVADAQGRVLARTALLFARLEAARFLLERDHAPDRFEELTHRLFGAPLPRPLVGAWPLPHVDARARLVGLITAHDLSRELIERFDIDWFANPRGVHHVRAIASAPAHEPLPTELATASKALARSFEETLG
ncbi:MAG: hypothetical protein ACLQVI_33325 [Polyangiaceae bacterium]